MFETEAATIPARGYSSPEAGLNERRRTGGGRQKPNPCRSAFAAFIGALAAVALALSTLVAGPVYADGNTDAGNYHQGGRCNGIDRLPVDSATCLEASWTDMNSSGDAELVTKSLCSDIGKVLVHVNLRGATDSHIHLSNSAQHTLTTFARINSVSCCLNKEDKLCIRQQVEPVGKMIKFMSTNPDGRYVSGDRQVDRQETCDTTSARTSRTMCIAS